MFDRTKSELEQLPVNILMGIMSYLPLNDAAHLGQTKKALLSLSKANLFWREKLKFYYSHEFKKLMQQEKNGQPLAADAYFTSFKKSYEQPFYRFRRDYSDEEDIIITKKNNPDIWAAFHQLYLSFKEGDVKKIEVLRKKYPQLFYGNEKLSVLLASKILDYRSQKISSWMTPSSQPIFDAAYNEEIAILQNEVGSEQEDEDTKEIKLYLALMYNQLTIIKECINHDNVNLPVSGSKKTPLFIVAERGFIDAARYLIEECHANTDFESDGFTSLSVAAIYRHWEVVKYLEEKGADINLAGTNYMGQTSFYYAVGSGDVEAVKYFVDKGANANQIFPTQDNGRPSYVFITTPILIAAASGYFDLVQYLVSQGVDINQTQTEYGKNKSPLNLAAEAGNLDIAVYLVNQGADVDQDSLDIAEKNQHSEVANFLKQTLEMKNSLRFE